MKRLIFYFLLAASFSAYAQVDSSLFQKVPADTARNLFNMDAVYNRPFLTMNKMPVSIGGYLEANYQHLGTDGVSEGHQFQARRLTLFLSSTIRNRIRFLSEIEFEDGTREINIEFAAVDFEFSHLLNLRGGIILNPIGAFNQNHDGPKWEFVDRPIEATELLPATWSNAGFGLYGKTYSDKWGLAYEAYLTNGFDERIIANPENRTRLAATKANLARFEESPNGEILYTGKIAVKQFKIGELGMSYMGGIYNKYRDDGIVVDSKRWVHTAAVDINATIPSTRTNFIAEWAWVWVDVPFHYSQQFGSEQYGGFMDIVQPLLKRRMLGFDKAVLNLACRLEYVDWNASRFRETGTKIGDDIWAVVPAISFRPSSQTVIRFNYRYMQQHDLFLNPAMKTGGVQFGFSTYF